MRINKEIDSNLYGDYTAHLVYNSMPIKERIMWAERYSTDVLSSNENEKPLANTQQMYECFNMLYLHGFNVDYVCDSFAEMASKSAEKIFRLIAENTIYGLLDKCSGHLIYDTWHFSYSITESLAYFTINQRRSSTDSNDSILVADPNTSFCNIDFNVEDKRNRALLFGLYMLAFKKLGEIETIHVGAGVRRDIPNNDDSVVVNKMPFQINMIDSSWLRTIVRTEGFSVRGHFRLQAYGVGHSLRRLIFIKPFEKHGYVRTARKIVHERKAINS